ncbi:MAG: hypothetical protein K5985_04540 [Lachnospiraceae bacterium]|nr:hypothetical protein [Lachnospiraceae bacterium]
MLCPGRLCNLIVIKRTPQGVYLAESGEAKEKVLLPAKQIPEGAGIGAELENVFLYRDSSDRLIATLKKPFLTVGHYGRLLVREETEIGYFLDMGLERDLLMPFREAAKHPKPEVGDYVLVQMYVDKSDRLAATMRIPEEKRKPAELEADGSAILRRLGEAGGELGLGDASPGEAIYNEFHISKACFKRAVGHLYKEGKVRPEKTRILLM